MSSPRVDLPGFDRCDQISRQGLSIDLEAQMSAILGLTPSPTPPSFWPTNGLVQSQLAAPKILGAEGVEGSSTLIEYALGALVYRGVEGTGCRNRLRLSGGERFTTANVAAATKTMAALDQQDRKLRV